jgi:hypothetical protein
MTTELVTILGFAITIGTIIWSNGKSSGEMKAWLKGHEQLDAARFDDIKKDIARIDAKI